MWILPRPGLMVGWWVEGMWQTCSGHQVKWFPYCQVGNCPFLPLRTEMGTCEATSARLVQSTWDCEEHRFYLRAVEKGCGSFSGSARPLPTWTTACEKERLTSKTWRYGYQRISIFSNECNLCLSPQTDLGLTIDWVFFSNSRKWFSMYL